MTQKSHGMVERVGTPGGFWGHPIGPTTEVTPQAHGLCSKRGAIRGTLGLDGRSVKNSWSQSDADSLRCVCKGLGVGLRPNPHTQPMRTHFKGRTD